ncbi:hypothetical protein WDW89_17830 [Deltaproteobacteria bacterium TL4]
MKTQNTLIFFVSLLSGLVIAQACASSDEKDKKVLTPPDSIEIGDSLATELQGTWVGVCSSFLPMETNTKNAVPPELPQTGDASADANPLGTTEVLSSAQETHRYITSKVFTGVKHKVLTTQYSDDDCQQPLAQLTTHLNFELGSSYKISSGETVTQLNMTVDQLEYTVLEASLAKKYNNNINSSQGVLGYCGFNNWALDIPQNITQAECLPIKKGQAFYTIFRRDPNRLWMGDENTGNGTGLNQRPSEIDSEHYYIKQ